MSTHWQTLQQKLGHSFSNPKLLERALTHRSFSSDHYERLEFLGDSVLNLAVSGLLFQQLEQAPEGDLSRIRANLVKQDTLVALAEQLGVSAAMRLGDGELKTGGRQRPSILADVLEALIGAIYLDAGYGKAEAVVRQLFKDVKVTPSMSAMGKDPKTELQEWLQGRKLGLPAYQVSQITGAAHQQNFCVTCEVATLTRTAQGHGSSRRAAEQSAAAVMLQQLKSNPIK